MSRQYGWFAKIRAGCLAEQASATMTFGTEWAPLNWLDQGEHDRIVNNKCSQKKSDMSPFFWFIRVNFTY